MAEEGVLVIADISGYTRFVSGVELEHATEIVSDLMGVVVDQLHGVAVLAKLEGDAAFCVARSPLKGEAFMAALVGCYDGFRRRLRDAMHLTTCDCDACTAMGDLDLKIVAHSGPYLTHLMAGREEITGPGAIVVHRLLKNSVAATTGLRGYGLMSHAAAKVVELDADRWGWSPYRDEIDDVGPMDLLVLDLASLWQAEQDRTRVVVEGDEAVAVMTFQLPAPPAVVWEHFGDPTKRQLWNLADRIDLEHPEGATGVGTQNHCVHGKTTIHEEILDWKPFSYCTLLVSFPAGRFLMTMHLTPTDEGTTCEVRIRPEKGGLRSLGFRLASGKIRRDFEAGMARLQKLLAAERAGRAAPPAGLGADDQSAASSSA